MRVFSIVPAAVDPRRARARLRAAAEAERLLAVGDAIAWCSPDGASDAAEGAESLCVRREDLHPDHWHKSLDPTTSGKCAQLAREWRADVAHVHHWQGLSRDLLLALSRVGIPAVITLHDAWAACPIGDRIRTEDGRDCDAVIGAHPCLACAGRRGPSTPWVPLEQGFLLLAERQRDLLRELELARVCWVTESALLEALPRWLATELSLRSMIEPDVEALRGGYREALARGAPAVAPAEWFEERMRAEEQRAWDERCRSGARAEP
jgi:hypothetical protein